jgi:hypothetical protein
MSSVSRDTVWAAAIFGGVGGACAVVLLGLFSAAFVTPRAVVWLFIVGSSAVAAAGGGGAGWAIVVRPPGRPGAWTGVAAGLVGVALTYMIHGGIVILATELAAWWPDRPPNRWKELYTLELGVLFGYAVSAVAFVPSAVVIGAVLGRADRRRTPH